MATLFTSETDKKKVLYLKKTSQLQYHAILNSTQFLWYRLEPSAEVESEINHVNRQPHSLSNNSDFIVDLHRCTQTSSNSSFIESTNDLIQTPTSSDICNVSLDALPKANWD